MRTFLNVAAGLFRPASGNSHRAMPMLVPCFNTVTYARTMVGQLLSCGFTRIILVDNASTYPPMLAFLNNLPRHVSAIRHPENKGPRDVFMDAKSLSGLPDLFCITDPDLIFNSALPPDFITHLIALTERYSIGKAGMAIDISDVAALRDADFLIGGRHVKIWEWEQQFWQHALEPLATGDPVFSASIDTTFAIYNKRFFTTDDPLRAVRVGGRFTCRHLPWYKDVGLPAEEERYYRSKAEFSFYLRERTGCPY